MDDDPGNAPGALETGPSRAQALTEQAQPLINNNLGRLNVPAAGLAKRGVPGGVLNKRKRGLPMRRGG